MRARRLAVLVGLVLLVQVVSAPASIAVDQVTVPTVVGQVVTVTWQGTVLPGANATSDCSGTLAVAADPHDVNLAVPAGTYSQVAVQGSVSIAFIFAPAPTRIMPGLIHSTAASAVTSSSTPPCNGTAWP